LEKEHWEGARSDSTEPVKKKFEWTMMTKCTNFACEDGEDMQYHLASTHWKSTVKKY